MMVKHHNTHTTCSLSREVDVRTKLQFKKKKKEIGKSSFSTVFVKMLFLFVCFLLYDIIRK